MARIEWNDIEQNQTLDNEALAQARGGSLFYYSVFRPYQNLALSRQSATTNRARAFNTQHNNFISFLRS